MLCLDRKARTVARPRQARRRGRIGHRDDRLRPHRGGGDPARPPAGENFTALSRMLARATFAATGAAFTRSVRQRIGGDDHALLFGPGRTATTAASTRSMTRPPPPAPAPRSASDARQLSSSSMMPWTRSTSSRQERKVSSYSRQRPRAAKRDLQLGAQARQRRAQLVRGVGREHPLDLEAPLKASEHLVQGLDEPADLVLAVPGCGKRSARFASPMRRARLTIWSIGLQRPAREQGAGESDHGEDYHDMPRKSQRPAASGGVRIVEGHRHLNGVAAGADRDRASETIRIGSSPKSTTVSNTVSPARRLASMPRRRGRRDGAEHRAARDDMTVEIRDLHELVEPHERRRRPRRDLVDAERRRGIGLRARTSSVVASERIASSTRPRTTRPSAQSAAERGERQHRREHRHLPEPQAGAEADRPHTSAESGTPRR